MRVICGTHTFRFAKFILLGNNYIAFYQGVEVEWEEDKRWYWDNVVLALQGYSPAEFFNVGCP